MNPYAVHLGDRDPFSVDCDTAGTGRLVQATGAQNAGPCPAPGDGASARPLSSCRFGAGFGFRLRQSVAEPHHTVQPFDQDRWAAAYATTCLRGSIVHQRPPLEHPVYRVGSPRNLRQDPDPCRTRRYDLPGAGGNHGRPRSESPQTDRPDSGSIRVRLPEGSRAFEIMIG